MLEWNLFERRAVAGVFSRRTGSYQGDINTGGKGNHWHGHTKVVTSNFGFWCLFVFFQNIASSAMAAWTCRFLLNRGTRIVSPRKAER